MNSGETNHLGWSLIVRRNPSLEKNLHSRAHTHTHIHKFMNQKYSCGKQTSGKRTVACVCMYLWMTHTYTTMYMYIYIYAVKVRTAKGMAATSEPGSTLLHTGQVAPRNSFSILFNHRSLQKPNPFSLGFRRLERRISGKNGKGNSYNKPMLVGVLSTRSPVRGFHFPSGFVEKQVLTLLHLGLTCSKLKTSPSWPHDFTMIKVTP